MDHDLLTRARRVGLAALLALGGCAGAGSAPAAPAVDHRGVEFTDVDGRRHALDGAAAFVFWQPWCKACREEAPEAVAASAELDGAVAFYGVVSGPDDVVDQEMFEESVVELGLAYPQVRDRDLALARRFDVQTTPMIVVVGGDGRVRYRGSHMPSDWTSLR